jgi:hypothetical protein
LDQVSDERLVRLLRRQRAVASRKKPMTIVQCAKAPDTKQVANHVPMALSPFSLETQNSHPADASSAAAARSKINIERIMLLSKRTAQRTRPADT